MRCNVLRRLLRLLLLLARNKKRPGGGYRFLGRWMHFCIAPCGHTKARKRPFCNGARKRHDEHSTGGCWLHQATSKVRFAVWKVPQCIVSSSLYLCISLSLFITYSLISSSVGAHLVHLVAVGFMRAINVFIYGAHLPLSLSHTHTHTHILSLSLYLDTHQRPTGAAIA